MEQKVIIKKLLEALKAGELNLNSLLRIHPLHLNILSPDSKKPYCQVSLAYYLALHQEWKPLKKFAEDAYDLIDLNVALNKKSLCSLLIAQNKWDLLVIMIKNGALPQEEERKIFMNTTIPLPTRQLIRQCTLNSLLKNEDLAIKNILEANVDKNENLEAYLQARLKLCYRYFSLCIETLPSYEEAQMSMINIINYFQPSPYRSVVFNVLQIPSFPSSDEAHLSEEDWLLIIKAQFLFYPSQKDTLGQELYTFAQYLMSIHHPIETQENEDHHSLEEAWLFVISRKWDNVREFLDQPSALTSLNTPFQNTETLALGIQIAYRLAENEQWALLQLFGQKYSFFIDLNAMPQDPENEVHGISLAYMLASHQQWTLLETFENISVEPIDLNAAPQHPSNPNRGITPAFMLVANQQSALLKKLIRQFSNPIDINANPENPHHIFYGMSLGYMLAYHQEWTLLAQLTENPPTLINLNTTPQHSDNGLYGQSFAYYLAINEQWGILQLLTRKSFEPINLNATIHGAAGGFSGVTLAWLLACAQQWRLLNVLANNVINSVDLNAAPEFFMLSDYKISLAYLLAYAKKWALLKQFADHFPGIINLNVAYQPSQDINAGITIAYLLVANKQWTLLEQLANQSRYINLNAAPKHSNNPGYNDSIVYLLINENQWTLLEKLVSRSGFIHLAEFLDDFIHEKRNLLKIIFEHNYNYLRQAEKKSKKETVTALNGSANTNKMRQFILICLLEKESNGVKESLEKIKKIGKILTPEQLNAQKNNIISMLKFCYKCFSLCLETLPLYQEAQQLMINITHHFQEAQYQELILKAFPQPDLNLYSDTLSKRDLFFLTKTQFFFYPSQKTNNQHYFSNMIAEHLRQIRQSMPRVSPMNYKQSPTLFNPKNPPPTAKNTTTLNTLSYSK